MKAKDRIQTLTKRLEKATDSEDKKAIWDAVLDLVEVVIEITPSRWDNLLVKPAIAFLRRRYKIG